MIIPVSTEVLIKKWPIGNLLLITACIASFVVMVMGGFSEGVINCLVLSGWNPVGLVGHQFLHAGLWHLLFNMLYLWVFGNAVCEKVGSLCFTLLFLTTGVLGGVLHVLCDGHPAVGASGAINGVIGCYLVLYPINRVNCFYWFFRTGTFDISGFWLIAFWFAVDAWSAFSGAEGGVAYWGHVGGFVSGFALGFLFLKTGLATMADYDNPTLLDYLKGRHKKQSGLAFEKQSFVRPASRPSRPPIPLPVPARVPQARSDINLDCPHCGQNLDVPGEMVGTAFRCPSCRGEIQLEAE